jgi:23S rRNA pseudouridine1911/1915/1917 synthase
MEKVQLKNNSSIIRLDIFLHESLNYSRTTIKQWILNNQIYVNNKIISKPSFLLSTGDIINATIPLKTVSKKDISTNFNIDYLYEDNDIVILNKPTNLIVHLGVDRQETTLVDILKKDNITLFNTGDDTRSGIVHRLDKMTEGLMVLAKTQESFESLTYQFKTRSIKKRYYCMLKGNLDHDIDVNQPIARHPKHRHKYCVSPSGKDALTRFFIKKKYNSMTLCDTELISGRTHQIRVHAHYLGHPIIGDTIYSKTVRNEGQLLQAYHLSLDHPQTKKRLSFTLNLSQRLISNHV